jgi:hypothetical protein
MSATAPPGLIIDYRPEGIEGLGELHVTAHAEPFAGSTLAYMNDDEVLMWASALRRYPWPPDSRFEIAAAVGDQDTLRLTAFPITGRGQLGVAVYLADIDTDVHSPTSGSVSEASMLIKTSYEAAHRFADDLAHAVSSREGAARLDWDELA